MGRGETTDPGPQTNVYRSPRRVHARHGSMNRHGRPRRALVSASISDYDNTEIPSISANSRTDIEPAGLSQNALPILYISLGTGLSVLYRSELSVLSAEKSRAEKE